MFGFLWLAAVKAINALLQLGILAVLARLLSPTEFGLIGLALIIISFSDIFTDLGFGPALTQKQTLSEADIYTSFTASLIFGLLITLTVYFATPLISSFFNDQKLTPVLRGISIVLLFKSINSVSLGLMYRNMRFKQSGIIQIISYAIGYGVVGILCARLDYGVWALVYANISQAFLSMILLFIYSGQSLKIGFEFSSFKTLLHFGGGYSLSKIFTYFGNRGDKIVVGKILGIGDLGLYDRGYQLVKFTAGLIGEIIDKTLFAPFSRKQDDRKLIGKVFLEITYVGSILLFPASVFIYKNSSNIVQLLLGEQWTEVVPIIKFMSLSLFFLVCTRVGSTLAKSLGDVYTRAARNFIYSVIVVASAIFATNWGINGVAAAVSGTIIVNYFLAFTQTHKLTKVSFLSFIESHLLGLLLAIVFYLITLTVSYFQSDATYLLQIVGDILILSGIYVLGLFLDYKKVIKKYMLFFK